MPVTVRLSAGLARLAGTARLQMAVQEDTTVAGLLRALAVRYPDLAPHLGAAVPVVCGDAASAERILDPGDEVALLVPVAGG